MRRMVASAPARVTSAMRLSFRIALRMDSSAAVIAMRGTVGARMQRWVVCVVLPKAVRQMRGESVMHRIIPSSPVQMLHVRTVVIFCCICGVMSFV